MISFRPLRLEDKEQLRTWRNLPQIRRFMLTDHEIGPEEHAAWFERVIDDPGSRYWIVRCENNDVGLLYLYDINPGKSSCYWGFYIDGAQTRGQNVGMFAEYFMLQYAFQELQLERVCCETLDFNRGVLRLHKEFGFVEEGRTRGRIRRDGVVHDVVCMAVYRQQWESKKQEFERLFRKKGLL